jgi:hypothetical protein
MKTAYFIWSVKITVQNKIDRPYRVFVRQIAEIKLCIYKSTFLISTTAMGDDV